MISTGKRKKISIKAASREEQELENPKDWLQSSSVGGKYWVRKTTGIFLIEPKSRMGKGR